MRADILTVQSEETDDGDRQHYINIGKSRNGPTSRVPVKFLAHCARFEG